MGFPCDFGAVTPTLGPFAGRALQLLDLGRLPFRQFVNQLEDCLLPGDANLNKLHNENDFIARQKKRLSLAGRKAVQLLATGNKFRNRGGEKVFHLSRRISGAWSTDDSSVFSTVVRWHEHPLPRRPTRRKISRASSKRRSRSRLDRPIPLKLRLNGAPGFTGRGKNANTAAQGYSAVAGSMTARTCEMRLAGKPPCCACCRTVSSSGAI